MKGPSLSFRKSINTIRFKMRFEGNDIEFQPLEGAGHFIWWGRYGKEVSKISSEFLEKHGY